ncbi:MAG TPA: ankyrin repeat domain-containing protein [Novimethylophilus sp.]|jgi:rhodanese-related sulfurtransferase|uniref:ankyrin repeat domain-containing protein n=1 Tax=Novimethylophilus sp. TaxID=2137426 RepID=UPI002F41B05A
MTTAFQRISPAQAADLIRRSRAGIQPLALFDTRDERSYRHGHLTGADRLTEQGFGDMVAILPKNIPVMIYCYHGNASQVYAGMFADFRFSEVYSVDGGYEALAPALPDPPALSSRSSRELADFITKYHFNPANLDSPWDFALTPLMRAALLGRDDLAEELLAHGINPHLRNSDGNNALWLACVPGNAVLVQRLIDAGINLDNRNLTGATALMYTASSGKPEMMTLLLKSGANPLIRTDDDYLAVELAATAECLQLLRHTAA